MQMRGEIKSRAGRRVLFYALRTFEPSVWQSIAGSTAPIPLSRPDSQGLVQPG